MKILYHANTDWYLYNFRLSLVNAARQAGHEVVLVSPPGPFGERLTAEGIRWIALDMNRRSVNPWSESRVILRLFGIIRRESPDLVHNFTIKSVLYGSLAARWAGIPAVVNAVVGMGYIFTSTDTYARLLRPPVRRLLKTALSGRGRRLILQNSDDFAEFRSNGLIPPDAIRLIRGSGVDVQRFAPRTPVTASSERRPVTVLMATRLLWDKGVGLFVEAARRFREEGRDIAFLLAGSTDSGNPGAVPPDTIDAWAREGAVTVLGHVDAMEQVLGKVDIVVLPSSYREGVPRILVEACSCGLPVITTDTPGCREIVEDGANGLLIPEKDAEALAQAIRVLADDPGLRARLGQRGREKVLSQYDERLVIGRTLAVYDELMVGEASVRPEN